MDKIKSATMQPLSLVSTIRFFSCCSNERKPVFNLLTHSYITVDFILSIRSIHIKVNYLQLCQMSLPPSPNLTFSRKKELLNLIKITGDCENVCAAAKCYF